MSVAIAPVRWPLSVAKADLHLSVSRLDVLAVRSAAQCPEFDDVPCFRKEDFGLRPIAVDVFGPLLFVNLAASPMPLAEMIDGIPQTAERFKLARLRLCERVEYEVACNWKVYIDNYLEGYHIPVVHPSLYRELDYANYRVETARYYSQIAPLRKRNDPSGKAGRNVCIPTPQVMRRRCTTGCFLAGCSMSIRTTCSVMR